MREQPRTAIPRLLAGASGLALAAVAGAAWFLAHLLRGLVDDGHALLTEVGTSTTGVVERSTEGMQTEAALLAASSAERFAHDMLGDAGTAVQRFQLLVLMSLLAGAFAIAVAVRRLPLDRWPEFAWAAAAIFALLPAIMLQLWLIVAIPTAICLALAAMVHCTRRHDLTLARGTAAARRQVTSATPTAQDAARRGSEFASRVAQSGREQVPAARTHAESLGRKGHSLAQRSAPLARASLKRLRRGDDEPS